MRDPDKEYLIADREGRDRDRYSITDMNASTGLNFRDLTLKEEVGEALSFHEDIDASQVEVDVRGAVVTLMGSVQSEREKTEAHECASDIDGVVTVINQIEVNS
jgi:osmotically-inducible protein OsmY